MYTSDIVTVAAYSAISAIMILAGLIFFIKYVKRKKFSLRESCEFMLPKEKAYSIALGNSGMIAYIVFAAIAFVLNIFL